MASTLKAPIILFISMLALLPSCGDKAVCDLLQRAQSLIERDSCESALALLDSIDRESLPGGEPKALHALLLSQARDKCYIDVENDSLIAVAVDYYSNSGDTRNNMLAHYYLGRVKFNAKDYHRCITAMIKALELARELDDKFWMGMAARGVSDVYHATYNSAEELEYAKIEYDNFKASGRQPYINYAALDMARSSFNANDYPQGFKILSQLNDSANKYGDNTLTAEIHRLIGSAYVSSKEYDKAKSHLKALCDSGMANRDDSILLGLALVYRGETMAAKGILQATYDMADISSNFLEYNVYTCLNNDSIALAALERVDSATNAAFESRINQGISHSVIDFYALNNEVNKAKALTMRSYMWLVTAGLILSVIVIAAGILLYRLRMRAKNAEIENRMSRILILSEKIKRQDEDRLTLSSSLEEMDGSNSALRDLVDDLFRERWETVNRLCDEYFEKGGTESTRLSIVNNVEAEIKRACSAANLDRIESMVNSCRGNMVARLRGQCPFLREEDVKFLVLVYAGFSPRAICLFTGIKLKYYYNKRARLFERITKSAAVDKELFTCKRG